MWIDEVKLNAYLDGELSEQEQEWLEKYLHDSPQTQAIVAQLREETRQIDRVLDTLSPPAETRASALTALKQFRSRSVLSDQEITSLNGISFEDRSSTVWESPTLLAEIKARIQNFRFKWQGAIYLKSRIKYGLIVSLGLVLIIAIIWAAFMLRPGYMTKWIKLTSQLQEITSRGDPVPTRTPTDMVPLPQDIIPISARFNGEIELIGYQLFDKALKPGEPIGLTLYWRALRPIKDDYTVFIQVSNAEGIVLGQDSPPAQGNAPTHNWQPGRIIEDHHELPTVENLSPGKYEVIAGIYNSATGQRLEVSLSSKQMPETTIRLAQIVVDRGLLSVTPLVGTPGISTTSVIVALQPISQGSEFVVGSIGRRAWPANNLPDNFILDEAETIGQVARMDIVQGQVIVREMLMDAPNFELNEKAFDYGIHADPRGDTATNINHLKTLGFNWVRFQISWKEVEARPGDYKWALWDDVIRAYTHNGVKILLNISKAPNWARPTDDDKTVEGFPADPAQYAEFVAQVAGRYAGQVQAIEIWDEENLYYKTGGEGRVDPAAYTELLKQAYSAIKAVDPDIIVVSGGLTPTGAPPPFAMDDTQYLQQMYAQGARDYFDALGVHLPGFANPPDANYSGGDYDRTRGYDDHRSFFFRNSAEAYRQVMVENGDQAKLLWVTEFGWPVWRFTDDRRFIFAQDNTLEEQAEYTVRAFEMGREWGWVGPMFLWNLDYNLTAPDTELANFGILNSPTYKALAALNTKGSPAEATEISADDNIWSPEPVNQTSLGETQVSEQDTAILIVLDISGSMAAKDFEPNRLGAAKAVISNFIAGRQGKRIGLVTFAGQVVGQLQPTLDHTMLKGALNTIQLAWDIGIDSGTAIGLGLNEAIDMLRDSKAQHKIIILLTDGANNSGEVEPMEAARLAKEQAIRVYTIGAAKQGSALLPFPDGRVEYRDSEIDEETLKEIATLTGGLYFRAEDEQGLQEIFESINDLENSR
jgi:Mg-chelatase subunit ChlD